MLKSLFLVMKINFVIWWLMGTQWYQLGMENFVYQSFQMRNEKDDTHE